MQTGQTIHLYIPFGKKVTAFNAVCFYQNGQIWAPHSRDYMLDYLFDLL
jgi:hypothetical protein